MLFVINVMDICAAEGCVSNLGYPLSVFLAGVLSKTNCQKGLCVVVVQLIYLYISQSGLLNHYLRHAITL